jgi:hypothetical protein
VPGIHITEGFCSVCQNSFDNWPNLIKPPPKPDRENCSAPRESTESTVDAHSDSDSDSDSDSSEYGLGKPATRPCHKNTYALEASSRNGCRFCALLVQSMVDRIYWTYIARSRSVCAGWLNLYHCRYQCRDGEETVIRRTCG